MKKPANNDFPILDQLRDRWSPRAFSDRLVDDTVLGALFEAARWAPSCFNVQPWRFIIATSSHEPTYKQALSCLTEWNRNWACNAPLLLFVIAKTTYEDGSHNRHAYYDCGQAMTSLVTQATTLGLFVHQIGGILIEQVRETYNIPSEYDPICGAALGYIGPSSSLSEKLRKKESEPRARLDLSDLAYVGTWGNSALLVRKK